MQSDIQIDVYVIPGGEADSLQVFDTIELLIETYPDLFLTIYRGMNLATGRWVITLISEKTPSPPYQVQIQHALMETQAELISVPAASLAPLIERYLARQAEMVATNTSFLAKHHPMRKKHYKKKNRSSKPTKRR